MVDIKISYRDTRDIPEISQGMVNGSILECLCFISNKNKVVFSLVLIDFSPGFVYILFQC